MQPLCSNEPRPPPYDAAVLFWNRYGSDDKEYCCAECVNRTLCLPCLITGALIGVPYCIFPGSIIACVVKNCNCIKEENPGGCCERESCCVQKHAFACCCVATAIDRHLPLWSRATVACVKSDAADDPSFVRSAQDQHDLVECKQQLDCLFCCTCHLFEWVCNTPCIRYCTTMCSNCCESWKTCGVGCKRCCRLVAHKCGCSCCPTPPFPPAPQKMAL